MLIANLFLTDFTYSCQIKMLGGSRASRYSKLTGKEELENLMGNLKVGSTLICTGKLKFDTFTHTLNFEPTNIMLVKQQKKKDLSEKKRVELHCHTNMSAMDALTSADKLVNRAFEWGHQAIAITDHGVVQGFPDAGGAVAKLRKAGSKFKVLYGVEAYEVNNDVDIVKGLSHRLLTDELIVFDLETTGTYPDKDKMIEIGAVRVKGLEVVDRFDTFVNPHEPLTEFITNLTRITDNMLTDAPDEEDALKAFLEFCGDDPVLIAHNAKFDTGFINEALKRHNIKFPYTYLDTLPMTRIMLPDTENHKLNTIADHFGLTFNHHRGGSCPITTRSYW